MTKTLATYPFLHLLLHPGSVPVLETQWLGFAGSADFRAALLEALRLARLHQVRGWVADDRRLGAVRPTDLDWCFEQLLQPLSDLGVRRFAHLEATEVLNRLIINNNYQTVLPKLRVQAFCRLRRGASLGRWRERIAPTHPSDCGNPCA